MTKKYPGGNSRADDETITTNAVLRQENALHRRVILLPSRLYCRYRNLTGSVPINSGVADFTAGREFHPALKNTIVNQITIDAANIKIIT